MQPHRLRVDFVMHARTYLDTHRPDNSNPYDDCFGDLGSFSLKAYMQSVSSTSLWLLSTMSRYRWLMGDEVSMPRIFCLHSRNARCARFGAFIDQQNSYSCSTIIDRVFNLESFTLALYSRRWHSKRYKCSSVSKHSMSETKCIDDSNSFTSEIRFGFFFHLFSCSLLFQHTRSERQIERKSVSDDDDDDNERSLPSKIFHSRYEY